MTSMPASRSALATTLAPRSCPSSPGLATTTRMRPCATVPAAPPAVAYLPPRAARARKLILRSQLGHGWIVASALFGVVILAAGVLFLTRAGHPGPPWIRVAAVSALPAGAVTEVAGPAGQVVVVDRRDSGLRAF